MAHAPEGIFGGEQGVAIRFQGGGTETDEATYQILDPNEQEMGFYTLVLRVRDHIAGRTAETEQDLFLEE
ncbi:MAG: hypothetical protein R3247_13345 [Rhodothermales bacterium]|nr:hypothetical protein [Rhodothermales bacterium]